MRHNEFTPSEDWQSISFSIFIISLMLLHFVCCSRKSGFIPFMCGVMLAGRYFRSHFSSENKLPPSCSKFIPIGTSVNDFSFIMEMRKKIENKSIKWISKFEKKCSKYAHNLQQDQQLYLNKTLNIAAAWKRNQLVFDALEPEKNPGLCGEHAILMVLNTIYQFIKHNWTVVFPLQIYTTFREKGDHDFVVINGFGIRQKIDGSSQINIFYQQLAAQTPAFIQDTWNLHERGGICTEFKTLYNLRQTSPLSPWLLYYFNVDALKIGYNYGKRIEISLDFPNEIRNILSNMRQQLEGSVIRSVDKHRKKFGDQFLLSSARMFAMSKKIKESADGVVSLPALN